jgi:hypothetical protein
MDRKSSATSRFFLILIQIIKVWMFRHPKFCPPTTGLPYAQVPLKQFWPYYWKGRYTNRSTDSTSGSIPGRDKHLSLFHGLQNFMAFVLPVGSFSPKAVKATKYAPKHDTNTWSSIAIHHKRSLLKSELNTGTEHRNLVSYWVGTLERNLKPERGLSEIFLRLGDPKVIPRCYPEPGFCRFRPLIYKFVCHQSSYY